MRPIGVFGGMFDPIDYGHLRTAHELHELLGLEAVAFLPAGDPPHRPRRSHNKEAGWAWHGPRTIAARDRRASRIKSRAAGPRPCVYPTFAPGFTTQTLHQPAAFTSLPGKMLQGPSAEPSLPVYCRQFAQVWPGL